MHDPAVHQQALVALCFGTQLPYLAGPRERVRLVRILLFGQKEHLDILAGPTCELDHQLTWTLHGPGPEAPVLDSGRLPCTDTGSHALLLAWAGYRWLGGRLWFHQWRRVPISPWQEEG